jgi:hypothetical protein
MNKIQDIVVPTKGTGKYLEVRALTFNLTPTNGISLYWAIYTEQTNTDEEGVETKSPGSLVLEGNLYMPQEEYDKWGLDDTFVIDWTATQLNLVLIEETTEPTEPTE